MIDAPAGWNAVVSRAATAGVVAFIVLQTKEFVDAGLFDFPGVGADSALIACGVFALYAVVKLAKSA